MQPRLGLTFPKSESTTSKSETFWGVIQAEDPKHPGQVTDGYVAVKDTDPGDLHVAEGLIAEIQVHVASLRESTQGTRLVVCRGRDSNGGLGCHLDKNHDHGKFVFVLNEPLPTLSLKIMKTCSRI